MEPSLRSILTSKTLRIRKYAAKFRIADHTGAHRRLYLQFLCENRAVCSAGSDYPHTSRNREHQRRCAALRAAVPSTNSNADTAIQWLSAVLGSDEEVAVAVLGFEVLATVVTAVVVVVLVAIAGFNVGCVACSVAAPLLAGSTSAVDPPSPGTSPPGVSVSPVGTVAPSGSTTTCVAVIEPAATMQSASKALSCKTTFMPWQ